MKIENIEKAEKLISTCRCIERLIAIIDDSDAKVVQFSVSARENSPIESCERTLTIDKQYHQEICDLFIEVAQNKLKKIYRELEEL